MAKIVDWIKKLWPFSSPLAKVTPEPFFRSAPTPGVSQRELGIREARTKIPEAMLLAFFRAIPENDACVFVKFLRENLDHHPDLDEIFCYGDGDEFGYSLRVTPKGDNRFTFELGYLADELMGDGGEWDVTFGSNGQVSEISGGLSWIS